MEEDIYELVIIDIIVVPSNNSTNNRTVLPYFSNSYIETNLYTALTDWKSSLIIPSNVTEGLYNISIKFKPSNLYDFK
jgi:hypothetical protein